MTESTRVDQLRDWRKRTVVLLDDLITKAQHAITVEKEVETAARRLREHLAMQSPHETEVP